LNLNAVNQFIGREWVYRTGDCWAVYREAALAVFGQLVQEIEIPETSSPLANAALFEQGVVTHGVRLDVPEIGCAVLFRDRKGRPVHIGLHVVHSNVLHCSGTVKHPGRVAYDRLADLQRIYPTIEYYAYVSSHGPK